MLGIASSSNPAVPPASFSPASPVPSIEVRTTGSSITVGADVESLAAMPEATDYWEDDFYKTTYTSREIAHALLQPSPRASFAAMWCAKEALHKADPSLANTNWQMIEVIHDDLGKPGLLVNGRQPAGALSLSHTDEIAFAVFVSAQEPKAVAPASPLPQQSIAPAYGHRGRLTLMISTLALLLSIAAFALSFLRH